MSLPVAALGALIAALLETSVLTELAVAGIKPDLVFVITVVVAMVVGFEEALVWAVVGGLLIDALAGRPLGATTLALLIVTGLATLAGRLTSPARSITVLAAVFVLSWVYQMLVLAILAATSGIGLGGVPAERLLVIAVLDVLVAAVAIVAMRAWGRRFGPAERPEW